MLKFPSELETQKHFSESFSGTLQSLVVPFMLVALPFLLIYVVSMLVSGENIKVLSMAINSIFLVIESLLIVFLQIGGVLVVVAIVHWLCVAFFVLLVMVNYFQKEKNA